MEQETVYKICINNKPLKGNDVAPPLTEGEKYPILNVITDSQGNEHYDVGLKSKYSYIRSWDIKDADEELPDGDKIHWCHPSRFVSNMTQEEMYEKSYERPSNYFRLSSEELWDIDKRLGIADPKQE